MPGRDGTGPMGMGPMTGGGRGFCVVPLTDIKPRDFGRGFFGKGRGRGCRGRCYAAGPAFWARGGDESEM